MRLQLSARATISACSFAVASKPLAVVLDSVGQEPPGLLPPESMAVSISRMAVKWLSNLSFSCWPSLVRRLLIDIADEEELDMIVANLETLEGVGRVYRM